MTLWALIRAIAGLATAAVVVFTLLVVRHLEVKPLGGKFSQYLPVATTHQELVSIPDLAVVAPAVDPGSRLYEKAQEQLAVGDLSNAADRLRAIVSMYPTSTSAPAARHIVTQMNMDKLLGSGGSGGWRKTYKVKPGDSFLGIAAKHDTTLDLLMYLNGLTDLKRLYPGDELIVMPLQFTLVLDPQQKSISLWEGERFIAEYIAEKVVGAVTTAVQTQVISKTGIVGSKHYQPANRGYRDSRKALILKWSGWQITALENSDENSELAPGMYLSAPDMEEIALLTRVGNTAEIRVGKTRKAQDN